ncbi:MAG: S46 family peptidase, partial [Ferruginibacter sp.]
TNHHCGFDAIQNHSTLQHNYIRDGFWAMQKNQEIPNAGLTATFIIRIEDVTETILKNIPATADDANRKSLIEAAINQLKKAYKKESYEDLLIRPFFEGNKYYLFVTETFRDVRLVGAPPAAIGNFGKDTDNWMWPRHTGDFSLFRIYAGKDNHPADYSPDNVPYVPKRALSISLKGMKEGDFSMVFGFPGRTNQYLPSTAIQQIKDISDPAKISLRQDVLTIMLDFMKKNEGIKIQYAAKYASVENAYKKWKGEVLGLNRSQAVIKKQQYETEFQRRVNQHPVWSVSYGTLLTDLQNAHKKLEGHIRLRDYQSEIMPRIEAFNIASVVNAMLKNLSAKDASMNIDLNKREWKAIQELFAERDPDVDQALFEKLMERYLFDLPADKTSLLAREWLGGSRLKQGANTLFATSPLCHQDSLRVLFQQSFPVIQQTLRNDQLFQLYNDLINTYQQQTASALAPIQASINTLQRQYMDAQMVIFAEKTFYPDANSTLRVTYGNVKGYTPRDGMQYDFYTYLDGIMEKFKPGDYEFDVPQKLIDLYTQKDFGRYGQAGRMPVCFIAANHTTGGNSGSPALNAYGQLVGLNFDRVWEGTMSDLNYDASICRNIMVDIRYVLFIIDKFAGAKHLIDELLIAP